MLRLIAVVLAFLLAGIMPLPSAWAEPAAVESDVDWTRTARIAGAAVYVDMEDEAMETLLTAFVSEGVNVVEADSELSNYLTDQQFEVELANIRRFAEAAHRHGLRVVWYYPVLEVISPRATTDGRSIYKDHPDWVQLGLDGSPNVFYGGEARVHWVEAGAESAWMSFESGYGDYYLDRIKRLASTGIDGLWLDVPLLNDIQVEWADRNPAAIEAFEKETGLKAPRKVDWANKAWKAWVGWRHKQIATTLDRIAEAAKSVSEDIAVIVENVTLDNVSATLLGLDGSSLKHNPSMFQVWEIDAISDGDSMRRATRKDWVSFIGMNKFAKGASGSKPSWVFTYGFEPEDAELVMAEAIATGHHPYETKIPSMTTSVGADYRRKMFGWIREHATQLFQSRSAAETAVLFSPESRDFVDRGKAHGLYSTTKAKDPLWWSNYEGDSIGALDYMAEYRGVVKWLLDNHVPFDVIVDPTPEELAAYKAVIAPSLAAISDEHAGRLATFVEAGGALTITGPNPTGLDEAGTERKSFALNKLLRRNKTADLPWRTGRGYGKGTLLHYSALIGQRYFRKGSKEAADALSAAIPKAVRRTLQVEAPAEIHVELRQTANEYLIHLVNGPGKGDLTSIKPAKVKVRLRLPDKRPVQSVELTAPGTAESQVLKWKASKGTIQLDVALDRYAMIVLRYAGPTLSNELPVASADVLPAMAGIPLEIKPATLLANDGDLDRDALRVTEITPLDGSIGKVFPNAPDGFIYLPPDHLVDSDSFRYTIVDADGAEATASLVFKVGPPASAYGPKWAVSMTGHIDAGTYSSLQLTDNDTFDIAAVPHGGGGVTELIAGTWINDGIDGIDRIRVTVTGQFSRASVNQTIRLYDFTRQAWQDFDSRPIGTGDDTTVTVEIEGKELRNYISPEAEMRISVEGRNTESDFYAWANEIRWDIIRFP